MKTYPRPLYVLKIQSCAEALLHCPIRALRFMQEKFLCSSLRQVSLLLSPILPVLNKAPVLTFPDSNHSLCFHSHTATFVRHNTLTNLERKTIMSQDAAFVHKSHICSNRKTTHSYKCSFVQNVQKLFKMYKKYVSLWLFSNLFLQFSVDYVFLFRELWRCKQCGNGNVRLMSRIAMIH